MTLRNPLEHMTPEQKEAWTDKILVQDQRTGVVLEAVEHLGQVADVVKTYGDQIRIVQGPLSNPPQSLEELEGQDIIDLGGKDGRLGHLADHNQIHYDESPSPDTF